MIHESNALPGKTTRWLAKRVNLVAVGFEEAKKRLGNLENVVCTGNPNKMGFHSEKELATLKVEAKNKLGIKNKLVLVFGGSQGAKKINETMIKIIKDNKIRGVNIIYATGPKHYETIMANLPIVPSNVQIEKYIYNMEEVMLASDIVVCRSGALTVSELSTVGVASILIPFPYAAENHQYFNAKTLEDCHAAKIIEEDYLTADSLSLAIQELLADDDRLIQMGKNAKKIDQKNSLDRIKKEIDKILQQDR